ncbi:MAG TPA: hypothetical protein VGB81_03470 [Devosia sp.]|jgi:hypothetical protein
MYKTLLALILAGSLAGCASTPPTQTRARMIAPVAEAPMRAQPVRQASAAQTSAVPELQPGPNYVASFPEADRRAACLRLNYVENTPKFARCMEGDFPENPYFRQ